MTALSAQCRFQLSNAVSIVDDVCEHLATHGVSFTGGGARRTLLSGHGRCEILISEDWVELRAEAANDTGLAVIREELAGHLIELAPELQDRIVWSGDGTQTTYPAWLCHITVIDTRPITPHMQRIRFEGQNLERYAGLTDIHVRLMLPLRPDRPAEWPVVLPSGVTQYPASDVLAIRKYTIRHIDPQAGTVDIDFVLHEDAGPGSDFAARARPGDLIGMAGPGGRSAPFDRDWYLFAGDETALPAMARLLERMPETAKGVALIEIADAGEKQAIATRSQIDIRWLPRDGAESGTTTALLDAVQSVAFPPAETPAFYWAGCEHESAQAIRAYLRKTRNLDKTNNLVTSYWRRGGAL